MPITIQLHGSATASLGDFAYTARGNSHGPIPPLVRRLIAERVIDANEVVTVARRNVICFKPCPATLWAEIDVVETDEGIVRRPAYIGVYAQGAPALAERMDTEGRKRPMGRAVQAEARP